MKTRCLIWALAGMLLVNRALADSYESFQSTIELDRHGTSFVQLVVNERKSSLTPAVSVSVWSRLHAEADARWTPDAIRDLAAPDSSLTSGPIRSLYRSEIDFEPGCVRLAPNHLALIDYWGLNLGRISTDFAVRIETMNSGKIVGLKLDDVFENGLARYHTRDGRVVWWQGAWFDETGENLIVVSAANSSNKYKQQVAVISASTGAVKIADTEFIEQQLGRVESRFLDVALDVAIHHSLPGLDKITKEIFANQQAPLPARVRAAVYLSEQGNVEATEFVRSLAELESMEWSNIQHPAFPRARLGDEMYWWKTIGYAAMMQRARSEQEK